MVTVNPLPATISGPTHVCVGAAVTLTNSGGGTWTSSNTARASIGATTGVATGVSPGGVTITFTLSTGCKTTASLSVDPVPAAISGTSTVCVGLSSTLTNSVPGGVWSSSDGTIATVATSTGTLTGVSTGTVVITYAFGSCYVTAVATVNPGLAPITGGGTLCIGSNLSLYDTSSGGIWSSSNTALATVGTTTGVVRGVAAGSAYHHLLYRCGLLRYAIGYH